MKKKTNLFTYIISMGLPAIILTGVLLFVENYPFGNNNFALGYGLSVSGFLSVVKEGG